MKVAKGEKGAGDTVRVDVPPEVIDSGIGKGDHVELLRTPTPDADQDASYSYFATERYGTLIWLSVLFVVVVLAVARLRGLLGLVGLAFGGAVVWWWMLPALLDGAPGVGPERVAVHAVVRASVPVDNRAAAQSVPEQSHPGAEVGRERPPQLLSSSMNWSLWRNFSLRSASGMSPPAGT